jgi:hypothetical protein
MSRAFWRSEQEPYPVIASKARFALGFKTAEGFLRRSGARADSLGKKKGRLKGKAPLWWTVLLRKGSVLVVEIAIMVMVVPITIAVPAVPIFVPPAALVFIAVRAGFREFVAPVFSLRALWSVMLDGFMKLVVRLTDALLTIVVCADNRSADEKKSR